MAKKTSFNKLLTGKKRIPGCDLQYNPMATQYQTGNNLNCTKNLTHNITASHEQCRYCNTISLVKRYPFIEISMDAS